MNTAEQTTLRHALENTETAFRYASDQPLHALQFLNLAHDGLYRLRTSQPGAPGAPGHPPADLEQHEDYHDLLRTAALTLTALGAPHPHVQRLEYLARQCFGTARPFTPVSQALVLLGRHHRREAFDAEHAELLRRTARQLQAAEITNGDLTCSNIRQHLLKTIQTPKHPRPVTVRAAPGGAGLTQQQDAGS